MKRATSFKKVVVCHTNDFKGSVNDKIKGWVEANGGMFAKNFTPDVTHLVVSKKAWKRLHPLVREARRKRTAWIVKYDWLEDSLMSKPVKALPVDKYLYERMQVRSARSTQTQITFPKAADAAGKVKIPRDKRIDFAGVEFDNARQEFEQDMGSAGFHPYHDRTGFVYIITLLRYDVLKTRFEKYRLKVGYNPPTIPYEVLPGLYSDLYLFPRPQPFSNSPVVEFDIPDNVQSASCIYLAEPWAQCIQLYESDETPHKYACYTQYSRPGTSKQLLTLAPPGSTWEFAWSMFQKFFKRRVGATWEARKSIGTEIEVDSDKENVMFQYQAPRLGEPEGLRETVDQIEGGTGSTVQVAIWGELAPTPEGGDNENKFDADGRIQEFKVGNNDQVEPDDSHLP